MKTTLGDFIQWLINNGYYIRGIESIIRIENGWSFIWTTQIGYISDQTIKETLPDKTPEEWQYWGR